MPVDHSFLDNLSYNEDGLVPAIVQSAGGRVLMMAWMNKESLVETIARGETVFFSRSRRQLWHKGENSGNTQTVLKIEADCDGDTLLITVNETGPACHTGAESCFDIEMLFIAQEKRD